MKQLTIISGLGRNGSSMLMQMLINAGMNKTGDAEAPLWEDSRVPHRLPHRTTWMDGLPSKSALKILAPHRFTPPKDGDYRWIWIHRDPVEQKKSQIKWAKWWAAHTKTNTKRIDYDIAEWTALGLAAIKEVGGPLLELSYEAILARPVLEALRIEEFLDFEVNPAALAAVVHDRSAGCLDEVAEAAYVKLPGVPQIILPDGVRL